ncbi:metal-sensing transcriptional repressor [Candidatus Dojkabacteria bacterium]|nr:metal-sensing transcriptional repressor [Candidatus Dojkabacteria bacterium]
MNNNSDADIVLKIDERDVEKLLNRIHRIQGQLTAVEGMIKPETDFKKNMIQLQAIISAMESVRLELIQVKLKTKILTELSSMMKVLK